MGLTTTWTIPPLTDFPLPPMRSTGVVYHKGYEWIHTQVLEEEGYYAHQVGDIIRVVDEEAGCDIFYELTCRARDEDGNMLPAYQVDFIIPEHVFAKLPTVNRGRKKKESG